MSNIFYMGPILPLRGRILFVADSHAEAYNIPLCTKIISTTQSMG